MVGPMCEQEKAPEVSMATTLRRTLSLTGMTFAFILAIRFWSPATQVMQRAAGSMAWQRLTALFHIETGLGREQFIFVGIVIFCFLLALLVQALVLWGLHLHKKRG
ncbi:hypothetical protein AA106556_0628 [Neokomagataea tanensis NBRC 106556]|uniref:Uncharacterized protein n=1 Tax=Neokomagataea tanensis NBRC 106556 TaxID=1223519 RepID=A0ABQ0QHK5_9PROT|nr:hypothetical protein AA106556_0628 [Neokomagataea tanensis NBRC 106556]